MEDQSKQIEKTSRRNFTKTMIAAAVAGPIIASMTGCPKPPASESCTCPEPQPGEPIKCEFKIPGMETEPHEPPIIVTNGSLRLDLNRELIASRIGPGVRNYQYKLREEYYTEINRVQVLSERERYISTYYYYLNFRQAYLGLWLQKNTATMPNQDPVWDPPTSGEPQILFSFYRNGPYNYLALETDLELTQSRFKRLRRFRYEHPVYSPNQAFRLAKWSLFYPTPANVITGGGFPFEEDLTASASTSESFQLAVTFEHVDHYRKRNNIKAA